MKLAQTLLLSLTILTSLKSDGQNGLKLRSKLSTLPVSLRSIEVITPIQHAVTEFPSSLSRLNTNFDKQLPVHYLVCKSALNKQAMSPEMSVKSALFEHESTLGLLQVDNAFDIKNSVVDELGMEHIRFNQRMKNIPVWGAEMILHKQNGSTFMNGVFFPEAEIQTTPSLSANDAIIACQKYLASKSVTFQTISQAYLSYSSYRGPNAILHLCAFDGKLQLVYVVEIKPNALSFWRIFVDASSGQIRNAYDMLCSIDGPKTATGSDLNGQNRTFNTYEKSGSTYMIDASRTMFNASTSNLPDNPVGVIWTIDAQNTYLQSYVQIKTTNNTGWNSKAISAHYNSGVAYDYYKNTFSRNSINGKGGNVISVINVSDQNGSGLDNAFWNGEMMCYGNGNIAFLPLVKGMDVAGHEITHGVVQNTANLEYQGQSGAINESMADIFGCMMDRSNWKIGEAVVKTQYYPSGALRALDDPHNGGASLNDNGYQPRVMSEYYSGSQDNGSVHTNSGIPNWAFYKFATAVTKEKAEQVYYRALTQYLTKTSQFVDLRIAVVQSCIDLYGASAPEIKSAKDAFSAVGIYANDPGGSGGTGGGGNPTTSAVDLPVNPGQDYILSYDVSLTDPNTIYQSSTTASNFVAKSKRSCNKKPSITDDGSYCVFVGSDHKIYKLTLGSTPVETVLSSNAVWDNVAISKDGKRMAAISSSVDSSIYVYDFATQKWKTFKLYNPSYSSGISTGNVLYADAIEFEPSGERIVYDALNQIKNTSGSNIDYYDIGLIKVWDNNSNTFGSGEIEKLYSQLPDNVSIGNPTFAKNSPYIIAFDYVDNGSNTYAVLGKNIITNDDDVILVNDQVSNPNYSKGDDKILYDATTVQSQKVVAVMTLQASKIKGNNDGSVMVPDAQWGLWYSTGTRPLTTSGNDITSFGFPALVPPAVGVINGTTITVSLPTNSTADLSKLVANFNSSPLSTVYINSTVQVSGASLNDFSNSKSTPVLYTVKAQSGTTKTYSVKVDKTVGIPVLDQLSLQLYPNPAYKEATLSVQGAFTYELINLQGKVCLKGAAAEACVIKVDELQGGIYLLNVYQREQSAHLKLIVE